MSQHTPQRSGFRGQDAVLVRAEPPLNTLIMEPDMNYYVIAPGDIMDIPPEDRRMLYLYKDDARRIAHEILDQWPDE